MIKVLRVWRIILHTLLLIFTILQSLPSQNYLVHTYTIENGLPSNTVFDLTQDRSGQIWFATRSGITVFDGSNWKTYTVSDGLPHSEFFKIKIDASGRIWVAPSSMTFNISYFDGNRWHLLPKPGVTNFTNPRITSLELINDGNKTVVAVGTTTQGLFLWSDKKWQHFTETDGLLSASVNGIVSLNNQILVATSNGISVLKNNQIDNSLNEIFNFPSQDIKGIALETARDSSSNHKENIIWLVGETWIGYIRGNSFKLLSERIHSMLYSYSNYVVLQPDLRGGLYWGNPSGIFHYNKNKGSLEYLGKENGLLAEGTTRLFMDRERNLWIASLRGVSKIVSMRFATYQKEHGLLQDEVTAIEELRPGVLVFGHNNGLTIFDGQHFRKIVLTPNTKLTNPHQRIIDLQKDSRGNIWVVVRQRGIARLDQNEQLSWVNQDPGLADYLTSVMVDEDGTIWVGSDKGLFLLKNGKFLPIKIKDLPRPSIRRIIKETDGSIYLTTYAQGVFRFKGNRWTQYRNAFGSLENSTFSVSRDSQGRVWVGSLAGLFLLHNNGLVRYREHNFQIDWPVYFIIKDSRKRLWFGTDNGVIRWNGKQWREYTTRQGLAGLETNRAAGLMDSNDRVWIGTDRGVSCYQEVYDQLDIPPPIVKLLSVEVEGQNLTLQNITKLNHNQNNLIFHFKCISFVDEMNIGYRFMLEGFDKEWITETKPINPGVRYTNLPPGKYRFHIQARNALGIWSATISSPTITIRRPFWKEWWFPLIVLLFLGLILYSIDRHFTRKRYFAQLEKQIFERTAQLRESERRYRTLFEESKDAVFISSPAGKFIDINPAGLELFGYSSKQEIMQINIETDLFVNPEERAVYAKLLLEKGHVKDYELLLKRKDGQPITVLVTANVLKNEQGNIVAYRGIVRDVTERRKLEQQLFQAQKMESIGTLAGGIAHDFNNILAGILGYASFIKMKLDRHDPIYKYIDTVEKAASRATGLTSQLLAFARGGTFNIQPMNLNRSVTETIKIISSTFDKSIEIEMRLYENLPTIEADPGQIQQLIMNLCVNARDAMPEGGKLTITTDVVFFTEKDAKRDLNARKGNYVILAISDTGSGMDGETLQRIFEPFYTTKEKGKGTGLGLAMVYGVVKNLNGFIDVESEPGMGSTFKVYVPVSGKLEDVALSGKNDTLNGKESVLVVDDEEGLRTLLKNTLETYGYKVLLAKDGMEAIEIYKNSRDKIHLVILDLVMPKMSGQETFTRLKEINPKIKVICSTGYSQDLEAENLAGLKFDHFIQKPYRINELLTKVRKVLDYPN